MFNKLPGSAQYIKMVKDVNVIYRIHETILILRSLKRYFSHPKNQYLTKVVLNFTEALYFWALVNLRLIFQNARHYIVFIRTQEVVSWGDHLR